jgi:hypothetical protein
MKQVFFHSLVVCFFLPFLGVIAFSLSNFGLPLMEQHSDKSIKFFIAFPYFLLIIAGLFAAVFAADRLSRRLAAKFGIPVEDKVETDSWDKLVDPQRIENKRAIVMKTADSWLKDNMDNMLVRVIVGLVIGAVIVF